MAVQIHDAGPALTEADLDSVERRLGRTLPNEYRAFLREHNGGTPWPDAFNYGVEAGQGGPEAYLWFFLSAKQLVNTHQRLSGHIPAWLFPVARTTYGDLVCITLDSAHGGAIYLLECEDSSDDNAVRYGDWHRVAPNLARFLAALYGSIG